jgi:septum formation protein
MIELFEKENIFLASKSPRRSQLLKEAGFSFTVLKLDVDESFPEDLDSFKVPEYIARKKAIAGIAELSQDALVIAADCIVLFEGQILEKPKDRDDSIRMISSLSGKNHLVISGVCISKGNKNRSFSVTTKVSFGTLNLDEILYYVDTYQPFDKAGSYGIQEWIGHCKVQRIEGSYTNVMGLPMFELYQNLLDFIKD